MVIYLPSSLHHVQPITRGMRLVAIFWIHSLVRKNDDGQILSISTSRSRASMTSIPANRRSLRLPTSTTIYRGDGLTPRVGKSLGRNPHRIFKTAALRREVERLAVLDDRTNMRRVAQHRDVFAGISLEDDNIRDYPRLDRAELP
jgi:hypothetical protein